MTKRADTPTPPEPRTKLRSFRIPRASMEWLESNASSQGRSANNLLNLILEQARLDDERAQALAASSTQEDK